VTTCYLVRHGTTDWVDRHILHGITDIPLNETGIRQARAIAVALKESGARRLYTSPLSRCVRTADLISEEIGLQPVVIDGLKELDFGWLEGKSFRDHGAQDFNKCIQILDQFLHHFVRGISGEPMHQFQRRIMAAWDAILENNPQGKVIIVGHSAVFNQILIRYFGENFPPGKHYYIMDPGSITEVENTPDSEVRLVRLNDTSHLNGNSSA